MSLTEGIMNFYIMINYRKIRSKNKSKENFFKIKLKEVGNICPKKYSSLIVNDIKMEFSIQLCKTILNKNIKKPIQKSFIKKESKINIMKIKSEEIRKNNINNIKNEINNSNKYTYIKPKSKILKSRKSKTPLENNLFQKAIKKVNFIEDIKKNNSTDKINFKKNEMINKKVKENHERIEKEDNSFISQKYPYMKKKALKENISPSTSFQDNNNKNKNKNITSNNQINNNINS